MVLNCERYDFQPPALLGNLRRDSPIDVMYKVAQNISGAVDPSKVHFRGHQSILIGNSYDTTGKQMLRCISASFAEMIGKMHDNLMASRQSADMKRFVVVLLEFLNIFNLLFAVAELICRVVITLFLSVLNCFPEIITKSPTPMCLCGVARTLCCIPSLIIHGSLMLTTKRNMPKFESTLTTTRNYFLCKV